MEEVQEPKAPTKKWNEDPERRKAYHVAYYQWRKAARPPVLPKPKKKCLIDWKNPVEVAALKRTYAQKEVECEVCKKSVHACSITRHRKSQRHLLAVAKWLKGGAAWSVPLRSEANPTMQGAAWSPPTMQGDATPLVSEKV